MTTESIETESKDAPIEAAIKRPAAQCFATFVDAKRLLSWVPGLRRAKVVRTGEDGHPLEVLFEFGERRTYSLLYTYDVKKLRVEWRPGVGHRDAVRGWASFEPRDEATCTMRYRLEPGTDRSPVTPAERSDPRRIVDAFVRFLEK